MTDPLHPQPAPTPATGDVWLDLVDAVEVPDRLRLLMLARRRQGIERYGVPLQRDNGRDHAADALQEALDGAAYCEAMGRRDLARDFLRLAERLLDAGSARSIIVRDLVMTCGGCPSQWGGVTDDDRAFYARYRHGVWRVDVDGQTVASGNSGHGDDGCCSWDELVTWAASEGVLLESR